MADTEHDPTHTPERRRRPRPAGPRTAIGPMVSAACYQHRHQHCDTTCRPLLPFPCGCSCHVTILRLDKPDL